MPVKMMIIIPIPSNDMILIIAIILAVNKMQVKIWIIIFFYIVQHIYILYYYCASIALAQCQQFAKIL